MEEWLAPEAEKLGKERWAGGRRGQLCGRLHRAPTCLA